MHRTSPAAADERRPSALRDSQGSGGSRSVSDYLELLCRLLLAALDTSRLLHAGKELLEVGVVHFKSPSTVRLGGLRILNGIGLLGALWPHLLQCRDKILHWATI